MINIAQYKKLKKYESKLTQAYKGKFLCGCGNKTINDLISVYNEVFDKEETYTTCPKCLLNMFSTLGEEYFKFKEQHPEADNTQKSSKVKNINKKKEEPKEIEVELADGEVATIANSVERTDMDGNKYRLK